MSHPIQQAWERLLESCREEEMPFHLRLYDGDSETMAVGVSAEGVAELREGAVVWLVDKPKSDTENPFAPGRIVIEFDAKTLARLLPQLVRETHRALGLSKDPEEGES